jgi:hypothetical protein
LVEQQRTHLWISVRRGIARHGALQMARKLALRLFQPPKSTATQRTEATEKK